MQIPSNSPAVGLKNEDGSIKQWPAVNVYGRPYDRNGATYQGVGNRQFVVVPSGFRDVIEIIEPVASPAKGKAVKDGE